MGKINVLDFQVANLIAAGEVVERPASAVKELLENSVDAGATEITVEIKKGGIAFIRVSDNGVGMSAEDLPVSIRRHATSKIHTASDLDGITTLGFRGEALAAISSVSNMRIMTKRAEDTLGSLLCSENGRITELSEVGCKNGTTVIVEELFANVPARRKFLKKDQAEAMAVTSIVEKIALSRPDISVKLIIDGNIKFQTVGDSKILSAVYAVLGREFASRLIEVDSMTEGIEVTGYIGRPDNIRSNRNCQYFFLNGRAVRSKTATAALEQAFESYIETEKFPCCVLYIYVHPTFVDVNVHPTKLEVKFSDERLVFEGIFCAVRNALMQATDRPTVLLEPSQMSPEQHSIYNAFVPVYDRIADTEGKKLSGPRLFDTVPEEAPPDLPVSSEKKPFDSSFFTNGLPIPDERDAPPPSYRDRMAKQERPPIPDLNRIYGEEPSTENAPDPSTDQMTAISSDPIPDIAEQNPPSSNPSEPMSPVPEWMDNPETAIKWEKELNSVGAPAQKQSSPNPEPPSDSRFSFSLSDRATFEHGDRDYRILGTAFQTYIFVELHDHVLIIDKHAAHERILFEQMKKIMQAQSGNCQMLLVPAELRLTAEEFNAVSDFSQSIRKIGFEFTLKDGVMTVTGIPSLLDSERANDLLITLAGRLADGTGDVASTRDSFFEEALYQGSCKAAVKAGRDDGDEHMNWIVDVLMKNPDIICCPHGRPVALKLTKHQIEHFFKRI
ncbi:MAG: DNA mismatch repair endonuclease MutL [Eubacteriales bacterium]